MLNSGAGFHTGIRSVAVLKNFVRVLIQTGNKRDSRRADVPTISELMEQYKTPEASRRLTAVFLDAGRFGKKVMDQPKEVVARVRKMLDN